MSSWERGYGDFVMRPDLSTPAPASRGTRAPRCASPTSRWADGAPVVASPRQILQRQADRLAERGLARLSPAPSSSSSSSTTPTSRPGSPGTGTSPRRTSTTSTTRSSARPGSSRCSRRIRNEMGDAGMVVESVKGECNFGQHEIAFSTPSSSTSATSTRSSRWAPRRSPPRRATASPSWPSTTSARATPATSTSRCATTTDAPVFAGDERRTASPTSFEHFLAGLLAYAARADALPRAEHQQLQALRRGLLRPDGAAWGLDNRTCAFRVVGHGPSLRVECRVPGGDVNPYLALAALVAGGPARRRGGARARARRSSATPTIADAPRVPTTLREAADLFDEQRRRARRLRRRGRRPLREHGPRRDRRLRRRRHRLGALPGVRTTVSTQLGQSSTRPPRSRSPRSPSLDAEETDAAIARAAAAAPAWRAVAPGDRARLLRRFAEVVDAHNEELAQLEVANSGHTISQRALGGGQRPRRARLLRRGARAARRAPDPGRRRRRHHLPRAARRRRASSCPGTSRCRSPAGASPRRSPPATRSS